MTSVRTKRESQEDPLGSAKLWTRVAQDKSVSRWSRLRRSYVVLVTELSFQLASPFREASSVQPLPEQHAGRGFPALTPQGGAHDYLSRKHLWPAASSSLQLPRRDGGAGMEE